MLQSSTDMTMTAMGKVFGSSEKQNFSEGGYLIVALVKVVASSRARLQYIPTFFILTPAMTQLQICESEVERGGKHGQLTEGLPAEALSADRTRMRHKALAVFSRKTELECAPSCNIT